MVRGSHGENDFDPCTECDAWQKALSLSKRCQAAKSALQAAGYRASMIRETLLVSVNDGPGWSMDADPLHNGNWKFTPRDGVRLGDLAGAQAIITQY